MARRVLLRWNLLPKRTLEAMKLTGNVSAKQAMRMLERRKCSVLTPIARMKQMAKRRVGKKKIGIKITEDFPVLKGLNDDQGRPCSSKVADGLAMWYPEEDKGPNYEILLHKSLKFQHPRYVQEVIDHEMDHLKDFKKKFKIPW